MDALTAAAFERRASATEARLEALQGKLLEASLAEPGLSTSQVSELQGVKELLLTIRKEAVLAQEERDRAVKAEASLRDENVKLRYRVDILKAAVREGDEKLKQATAAH